MTAFIIGRMKIHNKDWVEEYFAKVPDLIERSGGKFVVKGGSPSVLEGLDPLPDSIFIIEYESREAATAFWRSPEFAPFIKLRQTGSTLDAILVDGLE